MGTPEEREEYEVQPDVDINEEPAVENDDQIPEKYLELTEGDDDTEEPKENQEGTQDDEAVEVEAYEEADE